MSVQEGGDGFSAAAAATAATAAVSGELVASVDGNMAK